jgi:hypothetical protein
MGNPGNQQAAARQARALLEPQLADAEGETIAGHLVRAERIAEVIWRRWRLGPHRWQLKHLKWYLEHESKCFTPDTRYGYWLTVRALVLARGHAQDWLGRLDGPWVRPTG